MGALKTLPVSFKVQDRPVIIVGGGAAALAKARLCLMTGARVLVVGRKLDQEFFTPEFSCSGVELAERAFAPADARGAVLVFVAEEGLDASRAIFAARAAGVPLNVVDRPRLCDFYTPAIVNRAPLSVAISTEGAAPVLARQVRARIETLLSPELGLLARLGAQLRQSVRRLLPNTEQRRRFFADLFASEKIVRAVQGGGAGARRAAQSLLQAHVNGSKTAGTVSIVGAGPGQQDLLTMRAVRLLQEADVIVAAPGVGAHMVDVGRREAKRLLLDGGVFGNKPNDFKRLLVELGKKNHSVVCLVAGSASDWPAVEQVGRALSEAGLEFSLVPGVGGAQTAQFEDLKERVA